MKTNKGKKWLGVNKEYLDEWDKFLGINGIFRPINPMVQIFRILKIV